MNWNPTWICPAQDLGDGSRFWHIICFRKESFTGNADDNCSGRV